MFKAQEMSYDLTMKPLNRQIRELEEIIERKPLEGLLEIMKKRVAQLRMAAESLEDDGWQIHEFKNGVSLIHPFFPKAVICVTVDGFVSCKYGDQIVELGCKMDEFTRSVTSLSIRTYIMKKDPREEILKAIEVTRLMATTVNTIEQAKIKKRRMADIKLLNSAVRPDRRMLRGEPIFARIVSPTKFGWVDYRISDIDGIIAELREG